MKATLHCRNCGAELTGELELLSTKDPAVASPVREAKKPVCDPGKAYKSYEPLMRSFDPKKPAPLEFVPQLWLNPADVEAKVELVKIRGRLNGCCGLAGVDGPNLRCRSCKAEVGTMQSDCWTPLVFVPDPDGTELRKVSG